MRKIPIYDPGSLYAIFPELMESRKKWPPTRKVRLSSGLVVNALDVPSIVVVMYDDSSMTALLQHYAGSETRDRRDVNGLIPLIPFDGQHRALLAARSGTPITAYAIESANDFLAIPRESSDFTAERFHETHEMVPTYRMFCKSRGVNTIRDLDRLQAFHHNDYLG